IIPKSAAARLCDFDGLAYEVSGNGLITSMEDDVAPLAIADLLSAGPWHADGHDCADCPQPGPRRFYVHDYLVYQPSADEIQEQRKARWEAGRKGAASRWNGKSHGKSHSKSHGKTDGKTMPPTPTPTPLSSNDDKRGG